MIMVGTKNVGEFFVELDEDSNSYCIFHTEGEGHAYASYADEQEAKDNADEMNFNRKNNVT